MNGHHPSCKPSDRDLVWFCSQCGARELAVDVEEQLAAAKAEIARLTGLLQDAGIMPTSVFDNLNPNEKETKQ